MPGPAKKPDRKRRNTTTTKDQAAKNVANLQLVKGGAIDPGKPPTGMLKVSRDWWSDFWAQSELQLGLGTIDVHVVRRLVSLIDLRERARRETAAAPLVEGSQGQIVENPAARAMSRYDTEIRQLEDRLGLNPRGRLNLGIAFGQARRTIEDMNRTMTMDDEGTQPDAEDAAPSVIEV